MKAQSRCDIVFRGIFVLWRRQPSFQLWHIFNLLNCFAKEADFEYIDSNWFIKQFSKLQ